MADFALPRETLLAIHDGLLAAYGDLGWWPGDSRFEIMVGAVLTQNTAWTNVEKAIANLKAADALSLEAILSLDEATLAELIRPSGYFNIKAKRLKNLCRFIEAAGGEEALTALPTDRLRHAVLSVNGVGPETADDILLYAFDRPVFVIDAYTRRLLQRFGLASGAETYESLRAGFEQALGRNSRLFNHFHALIVEHAKLACGTRPSCECCCLSTICPRLT